MKRDKRLDKAAEELVRIIDGHLAKLPPAEREERWRVLQEGAAKIDARAKLEGQPKAPASRRAVRRHA